MAVPRQRTREGEALRLELAKLDRSKRAAPHLDGRGKLIEDVEHAAGDTLTVRHLLKSVPRGWQLLSPRVTAAGTDVSIAEVQRTADTLVLVNMGSVDMTYDLWVF